MSGFHRHIRHMRHQMVAGSIGFVRGAHLRGKTWGHERTEFSEGSGVLTVKKAHGPLKIQDALAGLSLNNGMMAGGLRKESRGKGAGPKISEEKLEAIENGNAFWKKEHRGGHLGGHKKHHKGKK